MENELRKSMLEIVIKLLADEVSKPEAAIELSAGKSGYEDYLGKNVLIRTVTHHYSGNVTEINNLALTLKDAAWIADDGRFHEALRDPEKFNEVEPYLNPVSVNLYAICDITEIPKLITTAK